MNDERLLMAGDQDALESLERKLQVVRDWVTGVAKRFNMGCFSTAVVATENPPRF